MISDDMAWKLVEAWHDAVNQRDDVRLRGLTTPEVSLGGPRGGQGGQDALVDWVSRSGITMVPLHRIAVGDRFAVVQEARWPGDPEVHQVVTVFAFQNERISSIDRFATLEAAREAITPEPDARTTTSPDTTV
jgi:hypothetical protein